MKKLLLAPLLSVFLIAWGCANQNAIDRAAILEQSLTTLETVYIAYLHLPDCDSNPQPCSDDAVVARVTPFDNAAFTAVQQYRDAAVAGKSDTVLAELLAAANAALAALSSATTNLH